MPDRRRQLPLLNGAVANLRHGSRDHMTCRYRCGNACDAPVPNESDNPYFGDLVNAGLSRRNLVRAGAVGALVLGVAGTSGAVASPALAAPGDGDAVPDVDSFTATGPAGALTFKPIPPNRIDAIIVPNGYDHSVIIRWGDEVVPGAPRFDVNNQSAAAQVKQFGYNNDFIAVLPLDRRGNRALLAGNHEYTNPELMFPDFTSYANLTVDQLKTIQAAIGMFVVEIERVGDSGQWRLVTRGNRPYNRRISVNNTRFELTGAAAGSPLLRTAADPAGRWAIGTSSNCAGGVTPWGTVLSGEENFNGQFANAHLAPAAQKPALKRYGFNVDAPSTTRWEEVDERFDLARHPNEANRFGWIVELDPFNPRSTPKKHTALGRLKHEGANVSVARDGRVAAYTGDDERFDYLYKFVSDKKINRGRSWLARRHNMTLLESGTLYVAQFQADGRGRWIPLAKGNRSLIAGMGVDEVLINTRLAADTVGATKMDRPEDVEVNPVNGKVYCALTNNTNRGALRPDGTPYPPADPVNPRNINRHGHILEITEDGGDLTAETFSWALPILCGDPTDPSTYFMGADKSKVSPISCPDNVAFDGAGNLWIATDGNALGSNDGMFAVALDGAQKGIVKQFLTVPFGAEACGPFISVDGKSVFAAVQHPGEQSGASVGNPASTWPDGDFAKPGVVVSWRLDGRPVGA